MTLRRNIALNLALLTIASGNWAADPGTTKVVLDPATFGKSYRLFSPIAQRVAVEIDRLIPGPSGSWDFSFATLGALILEAAQQPLWRDLLNASEFNRDCSGSDSFQICLPALDRLHTLQPALRALGYSL